MVKSSKSKLHQRYAALEYERNKQELRYQTQGWTPMRDTSEVRNEYFATKHLEAVVNYTDLWYTYCYVNDVTLDAPKTGNVIHFYQSVLPGVVIIAML